jgi:hypothetical protein
MPGEAGAGSAAVFHPGDLVTATVLSAATGYAIAAGAARVHRTRAGRAAEVAAAAGHVPLAARRAPGFVSPTTQRLPVVG